jgi:hypothetical protein
VKTTGSNPVVTAKFWYLLSPPYYGGMENDQFHWLAGILEGEGSFIAGPPCSPNCPRISIQMTDEDVIEKVAKIFGRKYHLTKSAKSHYKPCFALALTGRRAVDLMRELRPLMSSRRRAQIDKSIDSYDPGKVEARQKNSRILTDEALNMARELLDSGESLRSVSRGLGVHHESLRRRLPVAPP